MQNFQRTYFVITNFSPPLRANQSMSTICYKCQSYSQNQLSYELHPIFFQSSAPDELMSIIRGNCLSDNQNQFSEACSCRKHGIQCMSARRVGHGVGCSNSAVDLDTADEYLMFLKITLFEITRLLFYNYLNLNLEHLVIE